MNGTKEVSGLSLRRWYHLFWTTLLMGSGGAAVAGLALQAAKGGVDFNGATDILVYLLILLGSGMLVSVYSQLGFFAYLILNYMAGGVFSRKTWQYLQLVLSALALMDLVFLRAMAFREEQNMASDLMLALCILAAAVATAYFKGKATNRSAYIPAFFFMTAITIVEMIGVLGIGVNAATVFILVPLLVCNAFQMLRLHRILVPASAPAANNSTAIRRLRLRLNLKERSRRRI